jgi:hypothetical protein
MPFAFKCAVTRASERGRRVTLRAKDCEGRKWRLHDVGVTLQQVVTLFGSGAVSTFLCAGKLIGINCIGITLHLWHVICVVPARSGVLLHVAKGHQFSFHELRSAGQADLDGPVAYPRRATAFARAPQRERGLFSCPFNSRFSERAASTLCLIL